MLRRALFTPLVCTAAPGAGVKYRGGNEDEAVHDLLIVLSFVPHYIAVFWKNIPRPAHKWRQLLSRILF